MAYDEEAEIKHKFHKAFPEELNLDQLWALTLLTKRIRKYARNNPAFNNVMNRTFPHAQFRAVQKTSKKDGKKYEGLQITVSGLSKDNEEVGETEE